MPTHALGTGDDSWWRDDQRVVLVHVGLGQLRRVTTTSGNVRCWRGKARIVWNLELVVELAVLVRVCRRQRYEVIRLGAVVDLGRRALIGKARIDLP